MIAEKPCPRCGCHLVKTFECDCGACKDDYCGNCGRFTSFSSKEFVEMAPYVVRCDEGPVPHEHSASHRAKRIEAWMMSLTQTR
jgi:hypothetical protein